MSNALKFCREWITATPLFSGNMVAPIVQMVNVTKGYPTPQGFYPVLGNIHLSVGRGEFVVVTGPSGSGKSTLLNMASLLDKPSAGDILFNGQSVSSMPEGALCRCRGEKIGMVFQRFCLLPHRSALENVLFRFRYLGGEQEGSPARAMEALDFVGLKPLADRPARLLSAGEMQRVAIARALVVKPDLLVADEPTGNLDGESTLAVMTCFKKMNEEGITLLMVTHNDGLLRYASRHLVCRSGGLSS